MKKNVRESRVLSPIFLNEVNLSSKFKDRGALYLASLLSSRGYLSALVSQENVLDGLTGIHIGQFAISKLPSILAWKEKSRSAEKRSAVCWRFL